VRPGLAGAFTAWLGLIALRSAVSAGGSGRIAELFADLNAVVERILDPAVPAIRDQRVPATAAAPSPAAPAAGPPRLPVPGQLGSLRAL